MTDLANQRKIKISGKFSFPDGKTVSGTLKLSKRKSSIKLHSDESFSIDNNFKLRGISSNGKSITLHDCIYKNKKRYLDPAGKMWHEAELFINKVVIGNYYLEQEEEVINEISFSTTDLNQIFHDDRAFGFELADEEMMNAVLIEARKYNKVELGPNPLLFYYAGKNCIFETMTDIGLISVKHQISHGIGSMKGINIKNKLKLSIEPAVPVSLVEAQRLAGKVSRFLAVIAGRPQEIRAFQVRRAHKAKTYEEGLTVIPTHSWMKREVPSEIGTDWRDAPLCLMFDYSTYQTTLQNWIVLSELRQAAQTRYIGCISKKNLYDIDRIVAAANMFDILPESAFPPTEPLKEEIKEARDKSASLFKALPDGVDRNNALSTLGRLGKPSLPKKVHQRADLIISDTGDYFTDLQKISGLAVKLRNFYVHGSEIDYEAIKPHHAFLADTLEFIFSTSELIECGWSMKGWLKRHHSTDHKFSEYVLNYKNNSQKLLQALASQ